MKSKSSPKPFVILRRFTSIVPIRYRCAALLVSTVFLFPFILLAMGIGVLLSTLRDGLATTSRWVADAAGLSSPASRLKLTELPAPTSVSAANLQS